VEQSEHSAERVNRATPPLSRYLNLVMSLFYVITGTLVWFTNLFGENSFTVRVFFGTLLAVYGLFRFYRVWANK